MRKLTTALVVFVLMMVAVPIVAAQDGSPEAADESLLAAFGFPVLEVAVDMESIEIPTELEADRYQVVTTNATDDLVSDLILALIPEGMSVDDAVAVAEQAALEDVPSDDFYSLTFVGGTTTMPGSTNDGIVMLGPGSYIALSLMFGPGDEQTAVAPISTFEVTGELPELTDPDADISATLVEMTIDFPDTIPAGPQIWQTTNTGAFPHFIEFDSVSQAYTREQVQATLNMFFEIPATPGAEDVELIEEEPVPVDLINVLSPQQTSWRVIDLEPGNYIAFCWVPGPGDVPPHALLGMFKVFTVE